MSDGATPDGLLSRLDRLSGIGYSDDGMVKAIIDGSGVPESVTIDPGALRNGACTLGDAVVTAIKAALDDVRDQTASLIDANVDVTNYGSAPRTLDDIAREVTRRADELAADFDAVQRRLMDRLP